MVRYLIIVIIVFSLDGEFGTCLSEQPAFIYIIFLLKIFNKICFLSSETVIVLSSIEGGFFRNILFELVLKVNIMIMSERSN